MSKVLSFLAPTPSEIVPSLVSVSPSYADLISKRADIGARRDELQKRRVWLCDNATSERVPVSERSVAVAVEQDRRIAKLLGDSPPPEPSGGEPEVVMSFREIERGLRDLEQAESVLEARLKAERQRASAEICATIEPEVRARIGAVVEAALALHRANVAFTDLANDINGKEIAWSSLNPIYPRFAGDPKYPSSALRLFLAEAVEEGWLSSDKLAAASRK